jgi:hypothetical protein
VKALQVRGRVPGAGAALPSWGVILILLLWGAGAVEAHPGMQAATAPAAVGIDTAIDEPNSGPAGRLASASSLAAAPATPSAWTWVLLLILPGVAAARGPRSARGLALVVALLLVVFACASAVHSVHHLKDPRQAERCPVYSASQQVTGLTATPATPDLPPPLPTPDRPVAQAVQLLSRVLDGEQSRAPPILPA